MAFQEALCIAIRPVHRTSHVDIQSYSQSLTLEVHMIQLWFNCGNRHLPERQSPRQVSYRSIGVKLRF